MNSTDLQEKHKSYYTAREQPEVINIPEATYVSILGEGRPGTAVFYQKKKAILHFAEELQKQYAATENAFTSSIVEIFYWFDEEQTGYVDIGNFYTTIDLDLLHYRMAIRIPDHLTDQNLQTVSQNMTQPFTYQFEHFTYTAGRCVQFLHRGPLAGELETLPVLQQFATEKGYIKSGMHHEIHLVNFEGGQDQSQLRTILRDPVVEL